MTPSRELAVEGRLIHVHDGLVALPHIMRLTDALAKSNFTRTEIATPETSAYRHWVVNIPLEAAKQLVVYQPTLDAVRSFEKGIEYLIYRCYCNYASHGDMLFTHTDSLPGQKGLTALWYIAPEWNVEWGGETIFYDTNRDAAAVVSPRPGRLVVFDGSIIHAGRPPNRVCYVPRYTLAFKLEPAA